MKIWICLVAILSVGCSRPPSIEDRISVKEEEHYGIHGAEIYIFRLRDGTRCAMMRDYNKGGLSCEWPAPNANSVQTETT